MFYVCVLSTLRKRKEKLQNGIVLQNSKNNCGVDAPQEILSSRKYVLHHGGVLFIFVLIVYRNVEETMTCQRTIMEWTRAEFTNKGRGAHAADIVHRL